MLPGSGRAQRGVVEREAEGCLLVPAHLGGVAAGAGQGEGELVVAERPVQVPSHRRSGELAVEGDRRLLDVGVVGHQDDPVLGSEPLQV